MGAREWYTPGQSIPVAIRRDNIIHLQKDTSSLTFSHNTRGLSSQGTLFDFVGAETTEKILVLGIFFTPLTRSNVPLWWIQQAVTLPMGHLNHLPRDSLGTEVWWTKSFLLLQELGSQQLGSESFL